MRIGEVAARPASAGTRAAARRSNAPSRPWTRSRRVFRAPESGVEHRREEHDGDARAARPARTAKHGHEDPSDDAREHPGCGCTNGPATSDPRRESVAKHVAAHAGPGVRAGRRRRRATPVISRPAAGAPGAVADRAAAPDGIRGDRCRTDSTDLRQFLAFLEERGELVRVREPVDPNLEITEITDRTTKGGGPALLFENVRGSRLPVAINVYGSEQRMAWALGAESHRRGGGAHRGTHQAGAADVVRRQAAHAAEAETDGRHAAAQRQERAVPGSSDRSGVARRTCRSSPAGRRTAGRSSRWARCSRAIPRPASATSACTACRSTTTAPPACTGRCTRSGAQHYRLAQEMGKNDARWRWRSAGRRCCRTRPRRRCRRIWTRSCSPGFLHGRGIEMVKCRTRGSGGAGAGGNRPRRLREARARCAPRGRSATTPATTRRSSTSRCSTSPP